MNRLLSMRLVLGFFVAISACCVVAAKPENSAANGSRQAEPVQYLPTTIPSTLPAKEGENRETARTIIYLSDSSGSMLAKMPALKVELLKGVRSLKADQSFNVIFFAQRGKSLKCFADALVPATQETQAKLERFLNAVSADGTTDPISSIELAFRQHPQLIYFLTDGDFPDNNAVLAKFRELDRDKKVKVHTIAFMNKDDKDVAFIEILRTIAKETGGTFRKVNEEDL